MTGLALFLVFVTSLSATFAIIPLVLRFAHYKQLYDQPDILLGINGHGAPDSRRIHSRPMPRLGGIGIVLGFFISTFLWAPNSLLQPIYFASLLMFFVGFIDDLRPLSALFRLFIQFAVAILVVFQLRIPIAHINLTSDLGFSLPPFLGYGFSVFIIVGAINAINLADGLDGLAGGLMIISVGLLSTIYFIITKDLYLIFSLTIPLTGALLGFLRYNTHPASIFMGDGGSNWLGMMLGILILFVLGGASLQVNHSHLEIFNRQSNIPILSIVLCVALPILDTAFVMGRRLLAGRNPMSADKTHFHHTLMYIGLSHPQSVTAIYFLSLLTGALGIMPIVYQGFNLDWISFLAILFWVVILTIGIKIDENAAEKIVNFTKKIQLKKRWIPAYKKIVISLEVFNRYLIYGILSIVPLLAGIPHEALGYSALLGFFLIMLANFAGNEHSFFQSFMISIASSILLTAINSNTLSISFLGRIYQIQFIYNAIFILLLVSTIAYLLLTFRRKYFLVNPTDFLMISLPFLILFVPEPYQTDFRLNIISLRSLVFFVAIRALTRRYHGAFRRIKLMCSIGLLYVFLVSICKLRLIY